LAQVRQAPSPDDLVTRADEAARAFLAAAGLTPDARPTQPEDALRKEARFDPSPEGTVLGLVAPAWRNPRGEVVLAGEIVVSKGPPCPLERPLERAERAAKRLAKKAEDVAARFLELRAGIA